MVVGTVYNMTLHPRHAAECYIKTYMYDDQYQLQLIHSTPVEDVCQALFPFEGKVLAGINSALAFFIKL